MAGGTIMNTNVRKVYPGKITLYVFLTCLVAATGGLIFGYDIGISRWKARCAEYFPYSIHFGGKKTSVVALALNNSMLNASENGTLNQEPESRDSSLNGKLQALAIK